MRRGKIISVIMLAGCSLSACTPAPEWSAPARGAALFQQTCATCHGVEGRGGRAPDLTRLRESADGSFPDLDVLARIHDGGSEMPAFKRLALGPTVVVEIEEGIGTPVPEDMLAIWRYLETIQRTARPG